VVGEVVVNVVVPDVAVVVPLVVDVVNVPDIVVV